MRVSFVRRPVPLARWSLRAQLLVTICGAAALALALLTAIVSQRASQQAEAEATATAEQMAQRYAGEVRGDLESALETTRTLAQTMAAISGAGGARREAADSVLKDVLAAHPRLLGTWLGFEPDAYDGQDRRYAGAGLRYYDDTGRFFPGWIRDGGAIVKDTAPEDHEYEKPGAGDWYLLPLRSGHDVILDPYFYKVAGKQVLETSLATPVMRGGRIIGVAGVDISLADFQRRVTGIHPYRTGFAALIAANDTYVAHPDTLLLGKPVAPAAFAATVRRVLAGGRPEVGALSGPGNEPLIAVYVPLPVGATRTPWLFVLGVPRAVVRARADAIRRWTLALGFVTLLMLGAVVTWLLGRITAPLGEMADAARQIAAGEMGTHLTYRSRTELGALADAFRQVDATAGALTETTRELMAAAAGGRLGVRADASRFQGAYRTLVEGINQTVDTMERLTAAMEGQRDTALAFLEDARAVLRRVAAGDLTVRMQGEYDGANAEIRDTINGTTASLHRVVRRVRQTTGMLTGSAGRIRAESEVIAGVADRTSAEARRAAEASRSAGANVRTVAQAAAGMSDTIGGISEEVQAALRVTREAEALATQTVDRVDRLGASSARIGDVVHLIDEIARKVNLIALNAAVEAARAGESGRAFAVVAAEIKRLATQTSAGTADIRQLIVQVQADVGGTVGAMRGISEVIARLHQLSARLASAVEAQSAATGAIARNVVEAAEGTDDVSQAIAGVSEGAVTTAGGATQFMEASTELAGVAEELAGLVAAFRV